jgi:hypothetical protein
MNRTKKIVAVTAFTAALLGAGVAWAATGGDPSGEGTTGGGARSARLLGAGTTETKFVAITPCRLVDTRQGSNTPLSPNQTRRYDVRGTGATFAAQGGKAGGCGIPTSGVTAVELTVTAVQASGTGFLRVFPESEPTATFLNYTPTFNASNSGTVGLCGLNGGVCVANQDLAVKNYSNTTDLVVDVQGYYALPMSATVSEAGALGRTSRAVSATRSATGRYSVVFDRDISSCNMVGSIGDDTPSGVNAGQIQVQVNAVNDSAVFVGTQDSSGNDADRPFMIEVIC